MGGRWGRAGGTAPRWGPPCFVGRGRQGSRAPSDLSGRTKPVFYFHRAPFGPAGAVAARAALLPAALRASAAAEPPKFRSGLRRAARGRSCAASPERTAGPVLAPCRTCWLLLAALKNRSCARADIFCSLTRRADGFVFKTGCVDSPAVVQLFSVRAALRVCRGQNPFVHLSFAGYVHTLPR